MQQAAKFVDLRRTYLPVNANAFPTSMHGTEREDSPENRIPVMAYEGKNILPTPSGYKSYFGTDQVLNIDALTARADYVLLYQNLVFENVLIALTESGIWIKKANAIGAWTQAFVIAAPVDPAVHYDWTFVVISNILYVYRQNYGSYQKIESHATTGVVITDVVPNTLNMAGQMGIFRAGGRLGFWDSDDSVSWSNQDNYADFVPSIQTFAGSTKFLDVNGRIITILGHGPGFIMYCSKSIIYVQANTAATFQWDPKVIFSTNGITYPKQCVASSPDTTHFAYTSEGLFKIERGSEEVLVTEVTDELAKHDGPIYLSLSEGRYLYLQILDPDYLDSLTQFTQVTAGGGTYYFPGNTTDLAEAVAGELLVGSNMCATIEGLNTGQYAVQPSEPDKKEGTDYTPRWTAYLSNGGVKDASSVTWTNTPVATIDPNGVEANQCPAGNAGKTSLLSTDATNKTAVTGAAAYIDGIWTMQRFVQAQEAIWELEEQEREAFFNKVLARQKTVVKVTHQAGAVVDSNVLDKQLIGTYASEFTKGQFGFSKCEFWLTRWCVGAKQIHRNKRNVIVGTDTSVVATPIGYAEFWLGPNQGLVATATLHGTAEAASAAAGAAPNVLTYYNAGDPYSGSATYVVADGRYQLVALSSHPGPYTVNIYAVYADQPGKQLYSTIDGADPKRITTREDAAGRYVKTETMIATNNDTDIAFGPVPDTGYCTLVGWDYTKTDNSPGFSAATACAAGSEYPPGSTIRETPIGNSVTIGKDGSFCAIPFEPVDIDPVPGFVAEWPSTSVELGAGSFLMQDGSIAPIYPTFRGALIYDMRLKKWGNYDGLYKLLLNYSPINNSDSGVIPYAVFGILGGILASDGTVRLFTDNPANSYITYGKLGFYRRGITSCEEVHVNFDRPSTGYLRIDTSVDGRFVDPALAVGTAFTDASKVKHTGSFPGSWNNITISGNFEISYLQYNARTNGKR